MVKRQKALNAGLTVLAFLGMLIIFWLPPYGTEWIAGWAEFIGHIITFVAIPSTITLVLLLQLPLGGKITKKRKLAGMIAFAAVCAGLIGALAWMSFSMHPRKKIDRYLYSPNSRSKAVVLSTDDLKEIYPVRSQFFYERDKGVIISPDNYDSTFNWVDDNMLEIIRISNYGGEVSTEYLRW